MQQATLAKQESAAPQAPAAATRFVINLCSSTTPVALTPPDHAGLKRFTFFVSRRREEGRERFRLHMGYFDTQEEAEKLLDIVREIYPGAWAGLAPGQKLRGALADAAAATSAAAASAPAEPPAVEVAPPPAAPAAVPVAAAAVEVSFDVPMPAAPVAAVSVPVEPTVLAPALTLVPDEGRAPPPVTPLENEAATSSLDNVRAAIAALDDNGISAPVLRPIPELKAAPVAAKRAADAAPKVPAPKAMAAASSRGPRTLTGAPSRKAPAVTKQAPPAAPAPVAATPPAELDDAAALKVLESSARAAKSAAAAASAAQPEKPFYAVQLLWSVQPIDAAQVPQLAIFSAYTLYGAEGNRDGRRWYGLRLGFFTDTVSAKQVAHYVRSEFATVSVVPVTARERERAKFASTRPQAPAADAATAGGTSEAGKPRAPEFEFIEDKKPAAAAAANAAAPRAGQLPLRSTRGAPGKRAKLRSPAQVNARAKTRAMTLEETLEILGAGELKMDDGRGQGTTNAAGAREARLAPPKGKPSRLGRLFERLSGL